MFRYTVVHLLGVAALLVCATSEVVTDGWSNERVVGGVDAIPHSAPWIVSIQWGRTSIRHTCGGSILSPSWVVTAAHCLGSRTDNGVFVVKAGRHNLGISEPATEQHRSINRIRTWKHSNYTGSVGPYDIALIYVAPAFVFNAFIQPIALPKADSVPTGVVRLHGWGSISTTTTPVLPYILQTVEKPIIPYDQCRAAVGANSPLHVTNVCTGPFVGGFSACSGDSGGPLTQNGELIGIVSWGTIPCGSVNRPSVYVRVSAFIDWINEHMLL